MRINGWTGAFEDDMRQIFAGNPWETSPGDVWRWRAACEAQRAIEKPPRAD